MPNKTDLEKYYAKFNEENRLTRRHGIVEFETSMHFIHQIIDGRKNLKIADIGAGTGRYSIALCKEEHDVTAVELVSSNLEKLRAKHENVKTWQGDARNLSFLQDETFDITILFGPLYHLLTQEERLCALKEAERITKKGGTIFAAYIMNEYAMIQYCFAKGKILECLENKTVSQDFHCQPAKDELYGYVRLEDINSLQKQSGLKRKLIFAQDGASDYIRPILNAMDEKTFNTFIEYHKKTCCLPELLGASSHVVDVLQK